MSQRKPQSRRQKPAEMPETENDRIAGRNPVMEALRSGARIDMLYVGQESGGLQEIISLAKEQGIGGAELLSGAELKKLLIERFNL